MAIRTELYDAPDGRPVAVSEATRRTVALDLDERVMSTSATTGWPATSSFPSAAHRRDGQIYGARCPKGS